MRRNFSHADGRTYSLQVVDCRLYESWRSGGKRGGANKSTRDSDQEAIDFAAKKVKKLLAEGYVEGARDPGLVFDTEADVLATFRTDVDYKGDTRYPFAPILGRPFFHAFENGVVREWLMASDDGRRGVTLRTLTKEPGDKFAMLDVLLDALAERREEIFADRVTALRSFPLPTPVGRLTRLVVLSPSTANVTICRNVNIANHILGRSVYRAFPAYECEITGHETVTEAEARCQGHAPLPSSRWFRDPHPVFDLAYLKKAGAKPKFLIYDPKELDRRFGPDGFARMKEPEVLARNHAGVVRRFVRGAPAPDLEELRAFFGYRAKERT